MAQMRVLKKHAESEFTAETARITLQHCFIP